MDEQENTGIDPAQQEPQQQKQQKQQKQYQQQHLLQQRLQQLQQSTITTPASSILPSCPHSMLPRSPVWNMHYISMQV